VYCIVLYCIVLYFSVYTALLTARAFQKRSRLQQLTLCGSCALMSARIWRESLACAQL